MSIPDASARLGNLICLWDALPECARDYRNQDLPSKLHDIEVAMKEVLALADTVEDFEPSQKTLEGMLNERRIAFESHTADQLYKIGRALATVDHLLELSDALRTLDRNLTTKVEEADACLERARHDFRPLEILGAANEFNIFLEQGLAGSKYLNGQREKRARLLEAVEAAALKTFADQLKTKSTHLEQQKRGT
jgi:hypothetical protein